ncbi:hypothetical protein FYK26_22505 [Escherichia albertii]|uniref:hypothetical protein n=1 Tax=Escherichia albertii TaxID=208962 RepID=UPI000F5F74F1|nr:hypothetical protein [Escherichia albertii]QSZ86942.1 hypothetical protein FYK30_22490 [Escherichia albertii]QSZ91333.1 hypothetical protein FYK29_22495 [Escherichia albertii]QSZ95739.1 hypothetical protein FYK28_22520 [Escherichia albertii]QTA00125.1 hypothetical protein FYK27_22495 [Escherichia albertii]QTA04518.1 hypothetical protein FYK26_22505 [Escherichia albertii]
MGSFNTSVSNNYPGILNADNLLLNKKDLNTLQTGINHLASIAGEQNNTGNIRSPKAFLEFLVWVFTLGHVNFNEIRHEAGKKMMANVTATNHFKDDNGDEIMQFYTINSEVNGSGLSEVIIEIKFDASSYDGIPRGHTAIIHQQPDGSSIRYEGNSFERKDNSSLLLIANKVFEYYQRDINNQTAIEINNLNKNGEDEVIYKEIADNILNRMSPQIECGHLLVIPYLNDEILPHLLNEKDGILKKINDIEYHGISEGTSKEEINDEINRVKITLSHILIDYLDNAKVDLSPVLISMLEDFSDLPYINDVKILEWCFNKSLKYMNDESKIKYACEMVNKIDCGREQPKIAGLLLSILSKDAYRNNESIHDFIWGEVIKNVDVFELSSQEKFNLIQVCFNNAKSLFKTIPASVLTNSIFLNDFFINNSNMFSLYFPQLLEQYKLCKSELDKIEVHIDDLEKNKTGIQNKSHYWQFFNQLSLDELTLRKCLMLTILKSNCDISMFIDEEQLNAFNYPENLRDTIQKYGWKK